MRYIWPKLDTFGWYTISEGSAKVKLRWLSGACLTFYQTQKRIKNGANGYHQFAAAFFAIYQYILSTLMSTRAHVCVCGFNNNKLYFNRNFIHCNMKRKKPASWYIQVENYYRMQAHKREEFLQWQQQQQHLDYDKWWVSIKRWICTSCESIANFTFYSLNSNNVRSWANRLVSKSFYLTKWSPVMI